MNVSIGTPFQSVTVAIDTGSSDLVVNSPSSALCTIGDCVYGYFNHTASSSLKTINEDLGLAYTIGTVTGQWATETVQIGGALLPGFVIGVADNSSTLIQNVVGLGFPGSLVEGIANGDPTNQTTVGAMVAAGLIKSSSFSVYLSNRTTSDGAIIFGGLDNAHYKDRLHTYPIVPNPTGVYDRLAVNVSGVGVNGAITTGVIRSMLDTGEPDLRLPPAFVDEVWANFNVTPLSIGDPALNETWGLIECSAANSPATADVGFPGLEISIPFHNLVMPATAELLAAFGKQPSDIPNGTCLFNINHGIPDEDISVLGIPFLQSAYAVFNLDAKQISLAPINLNPGAPNITEIDSSTNSTSSAAQNTTTAGSATPAATTTGIAAPTISSSAGSRLDSWSVLAILSLLSIIRMMQ